MTHLVSRLTAAAALCLLALTAITPAARGIALPVSLGLADGDAMSLAMNPDGTYAYVTDSTEHEVVTLEWESSSPYFEVASTYAGSSSFGGLEC